jgi:molybdopterin-binding protein
MGNIVATNINAVRANSDRKNEAGVFEGINAPIVSLGVDNQLTGNIVSVQIGEGIADSGSGFVGFSGLYADGAIDAVSGSGDIRGDIIANQLVFVTQQVTNDAGVPQFDRFGQPINESTPSFGIGSIRLSGGGTMSGGDILVVDTDLTAPGVGFLYGAEGNSALNFTDRADDFTTPLPDIQSIRIDGSGGIIGSFIGAQDMGVIQINGGFGLVTTRVATGGDGQFQGVVTDGYGIRDCLFDGGAEIVSINARGTGKRLATTSFSPSVRFSEKARFDPNTGYSPTVLNDLHTYLGTSAKSPKRKGLSDAGVIEDTIMTGSRAIRRIDAHRIIGRDTFVIDGLGAQVPVTQGNEAYPMRISFPDNAGKINVRDYIDGLGLVGGGLESLTVKNDVLNARLDLNGRVKSISAGALRGTSEINVEGPDGQVDSITTRRSLYSRVNVAQDIKSVSVGTDLGSPFLHTSRHLRSLNVKGSILSGARVDVRKTLFNLTVGGDIQANATVKANNIDSQTIGGEVIGDIVIA